MLYDKDYDDNRMPFCYACVILKLLIAAIVYPCWYYTVADLLILDSINFVVSAAVICINMGAFWAGVNFRLAILADRFYAIPSIAVFLGILGILVPTMLMFGATIALKWQLLCCYAVVGAFAYIFSTVSR